MEGFVLDDQVNKLAYILENRSADVDKIEIIWNVSHRQSSSFHPQCVVKPLTVLEFMGTSVVLFYAEARALVHAQGELKRSHDTTKTDNECVLESLSEGQDRGSKCSVVIHLLNGLCNVLHRGCTH